MKLILLILFTLPFSFAEEAFQKNFFENSWRRDTTSEELRHIARAVRAGQKTGCTGFWVKNPQDRFFFATARHCYNWTISQSCHDDEIRIYPDGKMKEEFSGRCKQVIASSLRHDVAVIEVEIRDPDKQKASSQLLNRVKNYIKPLKLADFSPQENDRLVMYGFPSDRDRNRSATTTENCWILPSDTQSVWYALDHDNYEDGFARWLERSRNTPIAPQIQYYRDQLKQTRHRHNCSVYGGNSGGPILLEGTNYVIGLPVTYYPELYQEIPSNFGHELEDIATFLEHHPQLQEKTGQLSAI